MEEMRAATRPKEPNGCLALCIAIPVGLALWAVLLWIAGVAFATGFRMGLT